MTACGDFFVTPLAKEYPYYSVECIFKKGEGNPRGQHDGKWGERVGLSRSGILSFLYFPSGEISVDWAYEFRGDMDWLSEEEMKKEKPFSLRQKHEEMNAAEQEEN